LKDVVAVSLAGSADEDRMGILRAKRRSAIIKRFIVGNLNETQTTGQLYRCPLEFGASRLSGLAGERFLKMI
jgi:hypothetical protein